MVDRAALAALPRIDELVERAGGLVATHGRRAVTDALRAVVEQARESLLAGGSPATDPDALVQAAGEALARRRPGPPRRVVNATGVVVHTNLGRAPLGADAIEAAVAAAGYCDLEIDLGTGERGSRDARLSPLLSEACRAGAGIAVNNAAGALVLALAALAGGRQVLVSRGELVEIGGSFRLPEIMAASGARLVEVGTTNRTRASDFAAAGDDVAMILAVHPSNYRISGFTESPGLAALAEVAHARGVPLVHDAGSGLLEPEATGWADDEPSVAGALAAGADVVVASGDKLLGGPQAGLLVGDPEPVARCRSHPLARALRLDKLRIAALTVTLEAHLRGDRGRLPVWAMIDADPVALATRAGKLAEALGGSVVEGASVLGGGSAPGRELRSPIVAVPDRAPTEVTARLRAGDPPILARVDDDAVLLDPRTVDPDEDRLLVERVNAARTRA